MNKITARRIGIGLGVIILLGGLFTYNLMSQMKSAPPKKTFQPQIKMVETTRVQNTSLANSLEVQGQLVAFDKIDIFTEVTGVLEQTSRPFKVGSYFPKGEVLFRIDDSEARLSLLAQKSTLLNAITQMMPDLKIDYSESFEQWNTYLDNFDVEAPLRAFPEPLNKQEKFFVASRNLLSQFYSIKSIEDRLGKYTVRTPFAGVITDASVNPGGLVRAGQKLGELMSTGNYELQATVPLSDLEYLQPGLSVQLHSEDVEGTWSGKVSRINNQVDPGTQTVSVFIRVSGKGLREGMYLRGEVQGSNLKNAYLLPRNLLIQQNSVYRIKQDSFLELHPVEVVKITEEAAIVRGLKDGEVILSKMIPNVFDGMKVKVKPATSVQSSQNAASTTSVGSL